MNKILNITGCPLSPEEETLYKGCEVVSLASLNPDLYRRIVEAEELALAEQKALSEELLEYALGLNGIVGSKECTVYRILHTNLLWATLLSVREALGKRGAERINYSDLPVSNPAVGSFTIKIKEGC